MWHTFEKVTNFQNKIKMVLLEPRRFAPQLQKSFRSETLLNGHDISIWQCFVEVNYREWDSLRAGCAMPEVIR